MKRLLLASGLISAMGLAALCVYARAAHTDASNPPARQSLGPAAIEIRDVWEGLTDIQLFCTLEGTTYAVDFVGKKYVVGALMADDKGSPAYNVRLENVWMDDLNAGLTAARASPSGQGIPCALTWVRRGESGEKSRAFQFRLPETSPAAAVLRNLVRLYELPDVVVRDGDTLSAIAKKHLGSAKRYTEILAANPGVTERGLIPGMRLKIPAPMSQAAGGSRKPEAHHPDKNSPASARQHPLSGGEALLAEAAQTEFGSSLYGCVDTLTAAENAGIDYRKAVDGCLGRDRLSMHLVMWMSKHANLDAASSQGHSAVLGTILRKTGDPFFGRSLAMEPESIRQAVRDDLLYDAGLDAGNEAAVLAYVKKHYPHVFPDTFRLRR
jgi:phage tail protein X